MIMRNEKKLMPAPTAGQMPELIRLDADTGHLFWLERSIHWFPHHNDKYRGILHSVWNSRFSGKRAFTTVNRKGYFVGKVLGYSLMAHRVVFAIVHGNWPTAFIDHINGNPADNRPENLRDVCGIVNAQNAKIRSDNRSGIMGVSFHDREKVWYARITVNRKLITVGRFRDFESAVAARLEAEAQYGFHPNHGRRA